MNILELFAGSRSIGKVAEARGHNVFSVDITEFEGISLVKDIALLDMSDVPFIPDLIWSGTPCNTYSLIAGGHHRLDNYVPKTDFAIKCDTMNIKINYFISEWMKINPNMLWYIENPRGMLRKMPFMRELPRVTIWYCQYDDDYNRAKPTDIWSNNIYNPMFNPLGWKPKPECKNYKYTKEGEVIKKHCTHEEAVRGARAGTQGMKNSYERSKYPVKLCEEIIIASENKINLKVNHETI